ncbi:hypothetical protein GQX74_009886 [Glossina fuscipes]|nr:hypothetical protein GQX74_009886 [Glossina fuscipes]
MEDILMLSQDMPKDWREICNTCWALLRISGTDDEIFGFELFRLSRCVFEVKCSFRLFILLQLIIVGDSLLRIKSRSFGQDFSNSMGGLGGTWGGTARVLPLSFSGAGLRKPYNGGSPPACTFL